MVGESKDSDFSWIRKLDLNAENFAFLQESLIRSAKAEKILSEYQSLSCSICTRHFGFKDRKDLNRFICSAPCMAVEDFKNLRKNAQAHQKLVVPKTIHLPALSGDRKHCPSSLPSASLQGNRNGYPSTGITNLGRRDLKTESLKPLMEFTFLGGIKKQPLMSSCRTQFGNRTTSAKGDGSCQHSGCVGGSGCSMYSSKNSSIGYTNDSTIYKNLPGGNSVFIGSSSYGSDPKFFEKESVDETDKILEASSAKDSVKENLTPAKKIKTDPIVVKEGLKEIVTTSSSKNVASFTQEAIKGKSISVNSDVKTVPTVETDSEKKNPVTVRFGTDATRTEELVKQSPVHQTLETKVRLPEQDVKQQPIPQPLETKATLPLQEKPLTEKPISFSLELDESMLKDTGVEKDPGNVEMVTTLVRCPSGNSSGSASSTLRGNEALIEAARTKSTVSFTRRPTKLPSTLKLDSKLMKMSASRKSRSVSLLNGGSRKISPFVSTSAPSELIWTIRKVMPSLSFTTKASCYVQFVWSPIKFTLTAAVDSSKLDDLQVGIASYCKLAPAMTRCPGVGDIVFSLYMEEFYRAEVKKVNAENTVVEVMFLDYGDTAKVKVSDCREPSENLMKEHRIYGIIFESKLDPNVFSRIKLSTELHACLQEKVYIGADFETRSGFEWMGTLYLDPTSRLSWSSLLEAYVSSQITDSDSGDTGVVQNVTISTTAVAQTAVESSSSDENIFANMMSPKKSKSKPFQRFLLNATISPSLKNGAIVRVNHLWNYQKLTISAVEDDEKIQELNELIAEHSKIASPMKRVPSVDEIVIAPYQGVLYRGVVESVDDNFMVGVRFLDFGDEATVKVSELMEINAEIDAHPIYGIIFKLEGVPDNLPKMAVDGLEEAMDADGQMEILNSVLDVFTGYLWVANDRNWNEMILDAVDKL